MIRDGAFDLVLLDLNLPDGNTFELCRELCREDPALPVLFLTSQTQEEVAIRGLALGAADYLRKPFGRKELMLRIRRHLGVRRGRREFAGLVLDYDRNRCGDGKTSVPLTPSEMKLLSCLLENAESIVGRARLLALIDDEAENADSVLNTHLSRLRKKLIQGGATGIAIAAVYGNGYRLERKP